MYNNYNMKKVAKKIGLGLAGLVTVGYGLVTYGYNANLAKQRAAEPSQNQPVQSAPPVYTREALLAETNKHRATPLALDSVLNETAQEKCETVATQPEFQHGDISSMADSLGRYKFGENLAQGYQDAKEVLDAWASSTTHHQNLIDPEWNRVGFGICDSSIHGTVVVQHFSD